MAGGYQPVMPMHAISSYRGNRPTNKQTNKPTDSASDSAPDTGAL